ncbi:MAG: radical SAM protein [bacterium]
MRKRILKSIFFTKKPVHLILYVTNKCNLRCKTCFVDFDRYIEAELTLEEIERIALYLNELIWLDIGGGEPFLRKDLPEICEKFNTKLISIPTNGFDPTLIYETTKKIRSKTDAEVNIAVSLDGFEKTNDNIKAEGCFKKSIETLKLLKTIRGIWLKVNTVLCRRNYPEIIDFMKFIRRFNIDFHSIILQRGPSGNPNYECPPYEKLLKIKEDIFNIWNTYDCGFKTIESSILKSYQRIMYETSLKIIKDKKQIPSCVAGKYHLVIYPNGDLAPCEMLKPFGNIRKDNIESILESKKAKEQRRFIKNKNCYCYHNCNMLDNFLLNPLLYPKLLMGILRWTK